MTKINHCMIIAEAGVNHNGELKLALELIRAAKEAGADAVKFQTFRADDLVSADTPKAEYQKKNTDAGESQHEMLRRLELSHDDHIKLVDACREAGITFLSTGFDSRSLAFLESLQMPVYKIPSGELTNLPLLRQVAGFGKPVIMSTGMASLEEIGASMEVLERGGVPRQEITLLHCTTQYPAPMANVNLRAMLSLGEEFPGVRVGYSDHTLGIEVPIAAAALGARVLEKHFTLDRSMDGPDHAASLEPDELKQMVASVRNIEEALGSGVKEPCADELATREVARKCVVAASAIEKGDEFTEENLTVKRSSGGVSPMLWDQLLGRVAMNSYAVDEVIEHAEL